MTRQELQSATIIVPGRPLLLNRERKFTYWERAAAVKEWRTAGWVEAKRRRIPKFSRVNITATPHVHDRVAQDSGACFPTVKALIDGLVDAGVLPHDGPEVVRELTFRPVVLRSSKGDALELTITAAPLDDEVAQ